jgi:hypothetical protein
MPRPKDLFRVLLLIALALCALAPAEDIGKHFTPGERHTTSDPGSALYQRSAFAHGYIHGYELGFHFADLDYHVGRTDRKVEAVHEYRKVPGFHSSFGDKGAFERGYREGFLRGYDDSIHSRTFRAEGAGEVVAGGLKDYAGNNRDLDAGFADGFIAQRSNPQNVLACRQEPSSAYCNGFALGAEFAAISTGTAWPFIANTKLDAIAVK